MLPPLCVNFMTVIEKYLHRGETSDTLQKKKNSSETPVEWKFTTERVESRPVHAIFPPKEVITDVTTQGVTSVTYRVKIHSIFL